MYPRSDGELTIVLSENGIEVGRVALPALACARCGGLEVKGPIAVQVGGCTISASGLVQRGGSEVRSTER